MTMNSEQSALRAKLSDGTTCYNDLSQAEKDLIKVYPPDYQYVEGQREMITDLYLIAPNQAAITELNGARMIRLACVQDSQGRWLTLANALTGIEPGREFAHTAEAITNWPAVEVLPSGFPQEPEEEPPPEEEV